MTKSKIRDLPHAVSVSKTTSGRGREFWRVGNKINIIIILILILILILIHN